MNEAGYIGNLLMNETLIGLSELTPAHFQNAKYRDIFAAMQEGSFDIVELATKLSAETEIKEALDECQQSVHGLIQKEIKDAYNVRVFEVEMHKALAMIKTGSTLGEAVASIHIDEPVTSSDYSEIGDVSLDVYNDMRERVAGNGTSRFIKTGIKALDTMIGGLERQNLTIIAARASQGKELTLDTKVLLSCGSTIRMGDIMIGDKVASVDGEESVVTGVFPQGEKPIYRIKLSDGRTVDAGLDHQWSVKSHHWGEFRTLTTRELIEKNKCYRYNKKLFIPRIIGEFGVDKDIDIHPYLLGVLIGDGCLTNTVKLTTSHDFILNKIKPMLGDVELKLHGKSIIDYSLTTTKGKNNWLLNKLKEFGLIGCKSTSKFIPKQYFSATKETRLALMNGLMDTDGTVEKSNNMTYSTSSKQLAIDVQKLARGLGCFCSMSSRIPEYTYKGEKKLGKRNYCLYISHENKQQFVTIPHKLERLTGTKRVRNLNIESIEYIGDEEAQCISVSHGTCLYVVGDYTVTHNTSLAMDMAIHMAKENNVCFNSIEMDKLSIGYRVTSTLSNLNLMSLRTAESFPSEVWSNAAVATQDMTKLKLFVNDDSNMTVPKIIAQARKHKKHQGLDVLLIDYLGLIKGDSTKKRHLEIADMTRALKGASKELNCAVILLSQLNREADGCKPTIANLSDSSAVENDADLILFPYRANKGKDLIEDALLIVGKNRNGAIGDIPIKFHSKCASFKG